jgi:probable rRNA maturation factor
MPTLNFFSEEISFNLTHPRKTRNWVKSAIEKEGKDLNQINFIFCSDEYLRSINVQFLKHKTYTDIITFDNSDGFDQLQGDVFISIDRITENASKFKTTFDEELHRVIIHGVLHLMGYTDKDPSSKNLMRKKEDAYLSLRS